MRKIHKSRFYYISGVILLLLLISFCSFSVKADEKDDRSDFAEQPLSYNVGDTIKFGKYEQDGNSGNGKEDIEWIIVSKDGNSIFLLSNKVLDCHPYNVHGHDGAWDVSSVREWLNNDFYNTAFSSSDKKNIVLSENKFENDRISKDYVFLLSTSEASDLSKRQRIPEVTQFAINNGIWHFTTGAGTFEDVYPNYERHFEPDEYGIDTADCWLRSPMYDEEVHMAPLDSPGISFRWWNCGDYYHFGIRPAIRISIMPTGIGLNYDSLSLKKGESRRITASLVPENATNTTIKWSSSNSNVATVDQNGNVKAVNGGTADITATTANGLSRKCKVTVYVPPTKITLNTNSLTICYGEKFTLVPTLTPSDTTQRKVTYSSSNTASVTVNGEGVITGKANAGKATITAKTENGLTATCEVVCLAENNASNPFADVKSTGWEYNYIKYAYDNHYMTGKGELIPGKVLIAPNANISRAEFVQVLYQYAGKPEVSYSSKFSDVAESAWYAKAVIWASDNVIIAGKGNGLFDPSGAASREQIALMLYKFAIYKQLDVEIMGGTQTTIDNFEDASKVSSWAKDALNWALAYGIMSGKGTKLDPSGQARRSEFAAMLYQFNEFTKTANQAVIVPDVVGKGLAEGATLTLLPMGFLVDYQFEFSDTVDEQYIISQNPVGGTKVKPGSTITIVVSRGPAGPACPNLIGMTFGEARTLLEGMGITLVCLTLHEDSDYIVEQRTPAGEILPKNGAVIVTVSKTKPDLTGLEDIEDAIDNPDADVDSETEDDIEDEKEQDNEDTDEESVDGIEE